MTSAAAYAWLDKSLQTIHQAHWYRTPQTIASLPQAVVTIAGRPMTMFASNNYLGLAGDARLAAAAKTAIDHYGTGATGSRLVSGHLPLHEELETAIAQLKQTEAALVFSSGYLANLGTISALVGARDLVIGDNYNHACLKQGAVLSGAKVMTYQHRDVNDLAQQLAHHRHLYRRCLITTDTVFSMDGDLAPLSELVNLANQYECMLLVDEAHGTGVFGSRGGGLVQEMGIREPLIQVGTLSKALGSLGGYVAGSQTLIDFLRNRASTWIYTTGLSPADTAAGLAAVQLVQNEPERRAQLWHNVNYLRQGLQTLVQASQLQNQPLSLIAADSPILPVQVGDIPHALKVAAKLKESGIFAPAIRPPTVPTARLRFTVMATHTQDQLDHLIAVLAKHCVTLS
ncbi:MAG: 8-amino-7-oxononanoate synthase [Pseudanabaena sp. ELA607]